MSSSKDIFYVYILFRPWDGSPFYVGKGKKHRWLEHERTISSHINKHLSNILKKSREKNLEVPKVKIRENLSESDAFDLEIKLIAAIGRKKDGGSLVNMTNGGEGASGLVFSQESRAKISRFHKGRVVGEETRNKLREINLGNKHCAGRVMSQETREKIGISNKATKSNQVHVVSQETRAKLAVASRGNKRRLGKPHSFEVKQKMHEDRKLLWKDQQYRSRVVNSMRNSFNSPEVRESRKKSTALLWADPSYRAKQHTDESHKKQSETMKKRWSDPEYRRRVLQARKLKRGEMSPQHSPHQ